jgi:hypothetical protein
MRRAATARAVHVAGSRLASATPQQGRDQRVAAVRWGTGGVSTASPARRTPPGGAPFTTQVRGSKRRRPGCTLYEPAAARICRLDRAAIRSTAPSRTASATPARPAGPREQRRAPPHRHSRTESPTPARIPAIDARHVATRPPSRGLKRHVATVHRTAACASDATSSPIRRMRSPSCSPSDRTSCWSWDISKLKGPAKWTWFYLYVILDVFSRCVVGWTVQYSGIGLMTPRREASWPSRAATRRPRRRARGRLRAQP